MSKAIVWVIAGFVLAFGAGLVLGLAGPRQVANLAAPQAQPHPENKPRRWWIASQLDLSPQQEEQVRKIWEDVRKQTIREREERRNTIRQEREDAILSMLPHDKHETYENIKRDYSTKMAQVDREPPKSVQKAIDQTKLLLNDQQRAKYDEMLKSRERDRRFRGGPGWRGDERATTRPASTQ